MGRSLLGVAVLALAACATTPPSPTASVARSVPTAPTPALTVTSPSPSAAAAAPLPAWCSPAASAPARYASVASILEKQCFSCHRKDGLPDAVDAWNASTPYPFETNRPQRVLWRMRERLEANAFPDEAKEGFTEARRCQLLQWIAGGALDDQGRPPPWKTTRL